MPLVKDVLDEALGLPPEERARIAHELIVSLEETTEPGAEEAWLHEVERRLHAVDDGKARLESWQDVRARIAARLRNL